MGAWALGPEWRGPQSRLRVHSSCTPSVLHAPIHTHLGPLLRDRAGIWARGSPDILQPKTGRRHCPQLAPGHTARLQGFGPVPQAEGLPGPLGHRSVGLPLGAFQKDLQGQTGCPHPGLSPAPSTGPGWTSASARQAQRGQGAWGRGRGQGTGRTAVQGWSLPSSAPSLPGPVASPVPGLQASSWRPCPVPGPRGPEGGSSRLPSPVAATFSLSVPS